MRRRENGEAWHASDPERYVPRPRGYRHFDLRPTQKDVRAIIACAHELARHDFYPFIRRTVIARRLKEGADGKRRGGEKERPICYAAHMDAAIYAWFANRVVDAIEERYGQLGLNESVVGYRPKSAGLGATYQVAAECFSWVAKQPRPITVLCYDVRDFFGSLDHDQLFDAARAVLGGTLSKGDIRLLRSLTRYATVELATLKEHFPRATYRLRKRRTPLPICSPSDFRQVRKNHPGLVKVNLEKKGIPQGSPASAALSNLYMLGFDQVVAEKVARHAGIYRRYADDLLIAVPSSAADELDAAVQDEIKKLKLELATEKTIRAEFRSDGSQSRPLPYLGLELTGKKVCLRNKSLAGAHRKMRRAVQAAFAGARQAQAPVVMLRGVYRRHSHLGRDLTFTRYALRASAAVTAAGLDAGPIRQQLRGLDRTLNELVSQKRRTHKPKP